jgi:hypothetical protein
MTRASFQSDPARLIPIAIKSYSKGRHGYIVVVHLDSPTRIYECVQARSYCRSRTVVKIYGLNDTERILVSKTKLKMI